MTKKNKNTMNSFADYIEKANAPKKVNEYERNRRLNNNLTGEYIKNQQYRRENIRSDTMVNQAYANNIHQESNYCKEETAYLKQQRRLEYLNSPQGREETRLYNELRAFTIGKMITFLIWKPIQCITKKENNRHIKTNYSHYISILFYVFLIGSGAYLCITAKDQSAYLYVIMMILIGMITIFLWFTMVGKIKQATGKPLYS